MIGLLILISIFFLGYVVFTMSKTKLLKYTLTLSSSTLYGFFLFFIGMGVSSTVFLDSCDIAYNHWTNTYIKKSILLN